MEDGSEPSTKQDKTKTNKKATTTVMTSISYIYMLVNTSHKLLDLWYEHNQDNRYD